MSPGKDAVRLDGERRRTEWLGTFDVGSPAVLDWTVSEGGACLVTRAVRGVPSSDLTLPQLRAAWPSIAAKVKALHDLPTGRCPFSRRLSMMLDLARDVVARDAVNRNFLAPDDRPRPPSSLLTDLQAQLPERLAQEAFGLVVCHGDACLPNLMVDPETLRCTGVVDLGRLETADRYVDLALLLGNARERWAVPEDERAAQDRLFAIHAIRTPDHGRLAFYLGLDPLTWES